MIVGDIKNQIDGIWNDFWSGGVSNPLSVMEQITYLLFIRRLDELQSAEEAKAQALNAPIARRIFPEGNDPRGLAYDRLRWSRFKLEAPREMFRIVDEHVFPFIRDVVAADGTMAAHMKEARLGIPTPALLAKVVDKLDHVPMSDRDTKGDVYEYMLGKIASAGQNGQFRTPRHNRALRGYSGFDGQTKSQWRRARAAEIGRRHRFHGILCVASECEHCRKLLISLGEERRFRG